MNAPAYATQIPPRFTRPPLKKGVLHPPVLRTPPFAKGGWGDSPSPSTGEGRDEGE